MEKSNGSHRKVSKSLFLFLSLLVLGSSLLATAAPNVPGNRRDPFVPLKEDESSTSASSVGVKLEGIIYDPEQRSMAILNGKTYQAGDAVGAVTVVKILKDHVVVSVGEEEKNLWIREDEKK